MTNKTPSEASSKLIGANEGLKISRRSLVLDLSYLSEGTVLQFPYLSGHSYSRRISVSCSGLSIQGN